MLVKYDANGQEEWNTTWMGLGDTTWGLCVQQTSDGGYIVTGFTVAEPDWHAQNPVGIQAFLLKTDGNGNKVWWQTFPGLFHDAVGFFVSQLSTGEYIIIGNTRPNPEDPYSQDAFFIKTDNQGALLNVVTYHQNGYTLEGDRCFQTADKGFVLIGNRALRSDTSQYNAILLKLKEDGSKEWMKNYSIYTWPTAAVSGELTSDEGVIMCGSTLPNNWNVTSFLLKTDNEGNELWNRTYKVRNCTAGIDVRQTDDQGYVLVGFTDYTQYSAHSKVFFIKTSSDGTAEWNKVLQSSEGDAITYCLDRTVDGGYVVSGLYLFPGTVVNWDGKFVIKTDSEANVSWTKTFQWSDTVKPGLVKIYRPTNAFYFMNRSRFPLRTPLIIGWIVVKLNASDNETGIDHIDFYIDNKFVENQTSVYPPFYWFWYRLSFSKHTIKAVAYDKEGNSASCELTLRKFF
jgi:hypothetical protein